MYLSLVLTLHNGSVHRGTCCSGTEMTGRGGLWGAQGAVRADDPTVKTNGADKQKKWHPQSWRNTPLAFKLKLFQCSTVKKWPSLDKEISIIIPQQLNLLHETRCRNCCRTAAGWKHETFTAQDLRIIGSQPGDNGPHFRDYKMRTGTKMCVFFLWS